LDSSAPAVEVAGSAAGDDSAAALVCSEPFDSSEPDGLIRFAPLSTSSLAVSATQAPAACADSTIFVVIGLAAGRRLRAMVAVGRRLALEDDRADFFDVVDFDDEPLDLDLAEVVLAEAELADAIVRPRLPPRLPFAAVADFDLPWADEPLADDRFAFDRFAGDRFADLLGLDPLARLPLPLFLVEREALRLVRVGMTAPCLAT
jgi:hypothetical protein